MSQNVFYRHFIIRYYNVVEYLSSLINILQSIKETYPKIMIINYYLC